MSKASIIYRINFDFSSVMKGNSNFIKRNINKLLNTIQVLYSLDPFVATPITKFINIRKTQS